MTFFIPVWLMWIFAGSFLVIYFLIGWGHFAFDAGTSGSPGRLRYLFFWPYEWIQFIFGIVWVMIRPRSWRR